MRIAANQLIFNTRTTHEHIGISAFFFDWVVAFMSVFVVAFMIPNMTKRVYHGREDNIIIITFVSIISVVYNKSDLSASFSLRVETHLLSL
jgi:hypothetical protein